MYDKKVVVKAVCALCVVVVGFAFLYATVSNKTAASQNQNHSMRGKKRSARILQNELLFPEQICDANDRPFGAMSTVDGLCSYLVGSTGCCSATTVPVLPQIEPTTACPTSCLTQLQSFWCYTSCTDQIQNDQPDVNQRPRLCEGQVQAMFNACNGCTKFGTYSDFATYRALIAARIRIGTQTPCVAFFDTNTRLATETAAPAVVVAETSFTNPTIDFVQGGAITNVVNTATVVVDQGGSNLATNTPPPSYMLITYRTPAPNQDFANLVTIDSFDFVPGQPTRFATTHSISLGHKAKAGDWTLYVSEVANTNATQRNVIAGTFAVTNDFDPSVAGWGDVSLCSGNGNNNIGTPILRLAAGETVGLVDCCDVSGCTIACSDNSAIGQNPISGIGSVASTTPLTLRDCRIISTSAVTPIPASETITLPSTTTLSSTNAVFSGVGKVVTIGQAGETSSINSADASSFSFEASSSLTQVGDASVVECGISLLFAQGTTLLLQNINQVFRIVGGGDIVTQGTITMVQNNQVLEVSPAANTQRNHLFINGGTLNGNANSLRILTGRVEVQGGGTIAANVQIGPDVAPGKLRTLGHASKFAVQQSNPQDFVAEICCASVCGNNININPNAALFVVPLANSNVAVCEILPTLTPRIAARITGNLNTASNTRIVFTGASQDGPRLQIDGNWITGQNVIFEVTLSTTNVVTAQFRIDLAQWSIASGPCQAVTVNVILTNGDPTRPFTQSCDTSNNLNRLFITIPPVQVVNAAGVTPVSFRSDLTYTITMDQVLANFPEASFLQVLREIRGIEPNELDVLSYLEDGNNNIIATFQCLSTQSVQNADSSCAALVRDASAAGNSLHDRLNVLSSITIDDDTEDDDGSNTAMYGLFALALLIPLCLLAICLALKAKKRKADNQYMQDTATFSNVAASPQPINYPYPYHPAAQATMDATKPIAMAEPIMAVDAPPAYLA